MSFSFDEKELENVQVRNPVAVEYENIKIGRGEFFTDSHTKFSDGFENGRKTVSKRFFIFGRTGSP
jgi:hypothetical protein